LEKPAYPTGHRQWAREGKWICSGISRFEESAWSRIFGPHARIDRALPWQNPSEKRNPVLHSAFREGWEPKTRATANIWNVRRAASSSVQSLRKPVTLFG